MKDKLRDLQRLQKASGATVSACRAALDAAAGDVEDALELLSRKKVAADETPFDDSDFFTGPPLTRKALETAEEKLGFKFPAAYAHLLYAKNGGSTRHDCVAVDRPTSWARDHISITCIRGVGGKYGIDLATEQATHAEWGYPDFGFVFAETPTAGHTVVMFDYSECGPSGEPRVVWVDVYGAEPEVIVLAESFTDFLSCLTDAHAFEDVDGS
jgi:hypothetical protein